MYVNRDFYNSLSDLEKKAFEKQQTHLCENPYHIVLSKMVCCYLTDNHGVIEDTPADYFSEYMAAVKKALQPAADENKFFAEVWQSQKDFADMAVLFWAGAQASNAGLGKAHADKLK